MKKHRLKSRSHYDEIIHFLNKYFFALTYPLKEIVKYYLYTSKKGNYHIKLGTILYFNMYKPHQTIPKLSTCTESSLGTRKII